MLASSVRIVTIGKPCQPLISDVCAFSVARFIATIIDDGRLEVSARSMTREKRQGDSPECRRYPVIQGQSISYLIKTVLDLLRTHCRGLVDHFFRIRRHRAAAEALHQPRISLADRSWQNPAWG